MSYRDWHVGMKVVCVSDLNDHPAKCARHIVPSRGSVYTIREIFTEPRSKKFPNDPFVRLVEIVNAPQKTKFGPYECSFHVRHFRPVQPRKTDISIFTAMLTGTKAKQKERA